ncbi:STAS domain-containing protein [Microbacterium paludicola]|uniref:STAS domain-containing protein n=1 Tax=Microbacterium paludicola TaxID=300019 RepID=UPI003879232B
MEITQRNAEGYVALAPQGRFDMVNAPVVKARIDALVRGGDTRIVVDLQGVSFMDSSGLGALVGGLKTARQAGGDVRIAHPGEQVRAVLRLTKLDRILAPFESVEDASRGW